MSTFIAHETPLPERAQRLVLYWQHTEHIELIQYARYWINLARETVAHYQHLLLLPLPRAYYGDDDALITESQAPLVRSASPHHAWLKVSRLNQDYSLCLRCWVVWLGLAKMKFQRHQTNLTSPEQSRDESKPRWYQLLEQLQIMILLQTLVSQVVIARYQAQAMPGGCLGSTRAAGETLAEHFQALRLPAMSPLQADTFHRYSQTDLLIERTELPPLHNHLVAQHPQQYSLVSVAHVTYEKRIQQATNLVKTPKSDEINKYVLLATLYTPYFLMNYFMTLSFNNFVVAMLFLLKSIEKACDLSLIDDYYDRIEQPSLHSHRINKSMSYSVSRNTNYSFVTLTSYVFMLLFIQKLKAKITVCACIILLTTCFSITSYANTNPDWFEQDYHYVIVDQDVRDVLNEFGRNISMPIILSDDIDGRIRGGVNAETAGEFINVISEQNGLSWYQQGQVIHVDTIQNMVNRNIDVSSIPSTDIERLLPDLLIGRPLFAELNGDEVTTTGPQSWVEGVARRIRALESPPTSLPPAESVRVFRGSLRERISPDEY